MSVKEVNMYILVCGGRDYKDKEKVFKVLDTFRNVNFSNAGMINIQIVEGGAPGADSLAGEWARANHLDSYASWAGYGKGLYEVKADWGQYGKAAGPLRNKRMLENFPIDLVIAFKGGSGTQDMINKALKKGIIVLEVKE